MFKRILLLLSIVFALLFNTQAQVGIGIASPDASSMLDITSTTSGILIPRMTTTNRNAISSPVQGLLVYDTDLNTFWYYYSAAWHQLLGNNTVQIGDASNYTKINTDGTLEFFGNATVWNTFVVPASAMQAVTTPPTWAVFRNNVQTWQFLTAGAELSFSVQMPRDWKEGSDIILRVHWSPMTANSGDVRWDIEYTWANDQETFPATTTVSATSSVSGNQYKHITTSFSAITPGATQDEINTILMITLTRFPGTTFTGNAALLSFDILYESNTTGSRTPTAK